MLDLKTIRDNPEAVKSRLKRRGGDFKELDELLKPEEDRRLGLQESESLKNKKKKLSAEVGQLKQKGQDASELMEEVRAINISIKDLDDKIQAWEQQVQEKLLGIPNIPDDSIPDGANESANQLVRDWGTKPEFSFKPKNHVEIGERLDLIDFKRAAKISGSGFPLYTKSGARLERALINFMLEHHIGRGYSEVMTPFMALESATEATGQLPKLEEEMYRVENNGLYLIPTAEVPITNIHREEILDSSDLPIRYVAYSPCFRREAGSYGKETRGLLRVHQFNKVEMVKFVNPDRSYDELESLTADAESVLQALGLHYRVVSLCTGDLSFAAAKCYDLEVWAPGEKRWLEVSSCSNFVSFQARRAEIRFRDKDGKVRHVHTLNGSGVATPRLMIALLETYQTDEGTVTIPESLQSYFGDSVLK